MAKKTKNIPLITLKINEKEKSLKINVVPVIIVVVIVAVVLWIFGVI